jgi:hypothetical protein
LSIGAAQLLSPLTCMGRGESPRRNLSRLQRFENRNVVGITLEIGRVIGAEWIYGLSETFCEPFRKIGPGLGVISEVTLRVYN